MRQAIDLGDCLLGRLPPRYLVGQDYDWTYRLCWIKAARDYSGFYHMCPLRGPVLIGSTLAEAVATIDFEHAAEGAHMPGEGPKRPDNVYDFPF